MTNKEQLETLKKPFSIPKWVATAVEKAGFEEPFMTDVTEAIKIISPINYYSGDNLEIHLQDWAYVNMKLLSVFINPQIGIIY